MLAAALCDRVAADEAEKAKADDDAKRADPWCGGTARWLWQQGADAGPLQMGRGHFELEAGTSVFATYIEGGLGCAPVAELITSGLRCVGHYCVDEADGASRFATAVEVLQRVDSRARRSPRLKTAVANVLTELQGVAEPERELKARLPMLGEAAESAEDRRR